MVPVSKSWESLVVYGCSGASGVVELVGLEVSVGRGDLRGDLLVFSTVDEGGSLFAMSSAVLG